MKTIFATLLMTSVVAQAQTPSEVKLGNLDHKACGIRTENAPKLETQITAGGFNFRNCQNCEPIAIPSHVTEGLQKLQKMGLKDNQLSAIFDYSNNCVIVFEVRNSDVEIRSTYGASGGRGGVGNELKSGRTPLGVHKTALSAGEVKRIANSAMNANLDPGHAGYSNPIVLPTLEALNWPTDFVLSRFIRLVGMEPSLNSNSTKRKILFHGTHEEGLLNYDESGGCIRMANKDVIRLFDELPLGSLVNVVAASGQKASRYGNNRMKAYNEQSQLGPKKGGH
jgi:L,D-transpeptidase YbiS